MKPFFDARWIWVDIILYFSVGTRIVKSITVLVSTIKILIGNVYIAQEPITFPIKINKKERNVSFFPCALCCQSRLLRMHRKYDSFFLFPCLTFDVFLFRWAVSSGRLEFFGGGSGVLKLTLPENISIKAIKPFYSNIIFLKLKLKFFIFLFYYDREPLQGPPLDPPLLRKTQDAQPRQQEPALGVSNGKYLNKMNLCGYFNIYSYYIRTNSPQVMCHFILIFSINCLTCDGFIIWIQTFLKV